MEGTKLWTTVQGEESLVVRLDEKTGDLVSLRFEGKELVDVSGAGGLNAYFYLPGSDLKRLQRDCSAKISVRERGPLIASLLVESVAPGCRKLIREFRLHALANYLEIIDALDKSPIRTKEGVHIAFPFHVPDGVLRLDTPWAVVRPERDQIPGACKNWFTIHQWVDLSNKDYGLTWMTPDAPLIEIGGITANLIGSLSDPKLWLDHIDPSQTIYSWPMNNHWHTNYRAEQDGPTVFRYLIRPHAWGFRPGQASEDGLRLASGLVVRRARGQLPEQPRLVLESAAGVLTMSAFKPSEDGRGMIVRLFNPGAEPQSTKLIWSDPKPKAVWTSDNSEQPRQPLLGPVDVPPLTIVTLWAEL